MLRSGVAKGLFLFLFLAVSEPAWAHKAFIYAWVESDLVHTKSKLSGGKPVNRGKVIVSNLSAQTILEGETDAKGEFSFQLKKIEPLKIELLAGMGHKAEWTLQREDLTDQAAEKTEGDLNIDHQDEPEIQQGHLEIPAGCQQAFKNTMDETLDKKLQPLYKMLAELNQDKVTLKDILGGLGYIIGLMGLAAYLQNRKRYKQDN